MSRLSFISAISVFAIISSLSCWGQSGSGRIEGYVHDASGAALPDAAITLMNTGTGVKKDLKTNGSGRFVVPALPIGPYSVTIDAPGFKRWEGNLLLRVDQTAAIDSTMSVGSATEQMTVAGDITPLVNTENQTIGSTLDRERIMQLPENGRNIANLVGLTTPGVQGGSVNGMNVAAFEYLQDGAVLANEDQGGQTTKLPDPDSINEVKVETSNSSAKFNRPASAILTTKSGTNVIHGSLYETNRDNSFGVARKREDPVGVKAPQLIRNEFGASIGGPIYLPYLTGHGSPELYRGENKSFFFLAFAGMELRQTVTKTYSVPTDAMRNGDFSGLTDSTGLMSNKITLYDPLTTSLTAPYARQAFLNNQIDPQRISPLARHIYSIMPHPTSADNPAVRANLTIGTPNNDTERTLTVRVDQHFTDASSAYLRFTHSSAKPYALLGNNYGPPATDGSANLQYTPSYNDGGTFAFNHTLSPTLFSETVLSHEYSSDLVQAGFNPNENYTADLGLPNPLGAPGFPFVSGIGFLPYGYGPGGVRKNSQNITNLDENLTKVSGRHTLQFGGRYRHERIWILPDQNPSASNVSFSSEATGLLDPASGKSLSAVSHTGSSAADFFLGYAASYSAVKNQQWYHFRNQEVATYFQDDFKATPRLTLNMGIRWEIHPSLHERDGLFGGYDFKTGAIVTGRSLDTLYKINETTPAIISALNATGATFETAQQAGLPESLTSGNFHNIVPRIGAAYQVIPGRRPTVVRGGYGIYIYAPGTRNFYAETRSNPPYTATYPVSYTDSSMDGQANYLLRTVPTVVAGKNSANLINLDSPKAFTLGSFYVSALDPHFPSTFVQQWNATVEQGLMNGVVFRATYIGVHGSNLEQYWEYDDTPSDYVWYTRTNSPKPTGARAPVAEKPYSSLPYGGIEVQRKTGYSNNNSIQLEIQRLFKHGYSFQLFYVLSNAFRMGGNGWRDNFYEPQTYFAPGIVPGDDKASNRYQNYMRDTTVPQHQIRWNALVDLPFGKDKHFFNHTNRLVDALISGWQIIDLGGLSSQWWQPSTSNYQPTTLRTYGKNHKVSDCRSGTCKPAYLWYNGYIEADLINKPGGVQGIPANYTPFNTPFFPTPASGKATCNAGDPNYPNCSKYYETNTVFLKLNDGSQVSTSYSPGFNPLSHRYELGPFNWTTDASLVKRFRVTDRVGFQVGADFFNVLNIAGLNNPNASTGLIDPTYSHNTPRQIQLTGRVSF